MVIKNVINQNSHVPLVIDRTGREKEDFEVFRMVWMPWMSAKPIRL